MTVKLKKLSQADRREQIIECLREQGSVRVAELSELFSISEVTIRNDLAELENEGVLERVHGGAIQTVKNYYALDASQRLNARRVEKTQIASVAKEFVKDGENIIMNSGSTNYFIAQELVQKENIRIITNSIQIAEIFSASKSHEVILLGGIFNEQYLFTYGDDAIKQLCKYQVDKTILSADGIDINNGITTYHNEVASLCGLMLQKSACGIVVADHTKLGHTAFSKLADLDSIDYLITDQNSEDFDLSVFDEYSMKVVTPSRNSKYKQQTLSE